MSKTNEMLVLTYNKGYRINKEGAVINPSGDFRKVTVSGGYQKFNVRINGFHYPIRVHKLQAYQKYGEEVFKKGIVIRHKNGNSLDNSNENILIGTFSDNMMDQPVEVRLARSRHAASFNIKYPKDEVKEFYNNCKSYKETMENFNISSKGTLWFILNK